MVLGTILLASVFLINYLRKEEVKRIDLFVSAIKFQQNVIAPTTDVQDLLLQIYSSNNTIPVVILDKSDNIIEFKNLPNELNYTDPEVKIIAKNMAKNYPAIEIKFQDGNNQFVYYDNSRLLNNLRYSPYFLGLLIMSYFVFSFWFLRTIKKTDEGFLWAGLAKETAHQIGTPLSSMIGWIEIMRMENVQTEAAGEIEKDVERLKTISERFSKIGSVPELNDLNFTETLQQNFDYLKKRISTKVEFVLNLPNEDVLIPHNRILLNWVIENMVKNAVDAMKGDGVLDIYLSERAKYITLDIKDSGSGMPRKLAKNVFKPGYSTKKRGWGLGLSLAKRVIEEYHKGEIKVVESDLGRGTTFRITLKNS
jgi:two-component sensor histidine kinase